MSDKRDEALKLALEYLRDNQHYIADNERHAYVMEYNAFVERLEALTEQPAQQSTESVTYKEVADAMNALYMGDSKQVQIAKGMENKRLYTSPQPSKPWVGLTEQEENALWEGTDSDWELMKRTEAKLREKNELV